MNKRTAVGYDMRIGGLISLAIGVALFVSSVAQSQEGSAQPTTPSAPQSIDVYEDAKLSRWSKTDDPYPASLRRKEREGWVNLNFMVNSSGRAYEVSVIDSLGGDEFEKEAIQAIERARFKPATLNGKPVDSGMTFRMAYSMFGSAREEYAATYKTLAQAVGRNDRSAADSAMQNLLPINLREDAYFGFAQYLYAKAWGTEAEQLTGLNRALAYETRRRSLPKDTFQFALQARLALQVSAQDFGGALQTWEVLKDTDMDVAARREVQPIIDKIERFRIDDRPYSIAGGITDRPWTIALFRRKFGFKVSEGHIAEIKLRCKRKYMFFRFEPNMQYEVSDKVRDCTLQAIGDPGTKFSFVQM